MDHISLLKSVMLFPNDDTRSVISAISFPSSMVIANQLPTWDLDMMTLKRQIPEHLLPFKKSNFLKLTVFLDSGVSDFIRQA